ncbi:hypothetical protein ElyMa_006767400 [Elysia marginata]|uniref:Uncharacterized protein n=1 Tax=Elysia marginata TaxID=1093978 RepID=A0AAV4J3L8_9GAST|nr:hypothetical protein ElyMa_006767400 [Elysia marginata]
MLTKSRKTTTQTCQLPNPLCGCIKRNSRKPRHRAYRKRRKGVINSGDACSNSQSSNSSSISSNSVVVVIVVVVVAAVVCVLAVVVVL